MLHVVPILFNDFLAELKRSKMQKGKSSKHKKSEGKAMKRQKIRHCDSIVSRAHFIRIQVPFNIYLEYTHRVPREWKIEKYPKESERTSDQVFSIARAPRGGARIFRRILHTPNRSPVLIPLVSPCNDDSPHECIKAGKWDARPSAKLKCSANRGRAGKVSPCEWPAAAPRRGQWAKNEEGGRRIQARIKDRLGGGGSNLKVGPR